MNTNSNLNRLVKRIVENKTAEVKMGVDQHARDVVVSVQEDAASPKRAVKMDAEQLIGLAEALIKAGVKVHLCYEAGPCGYWLCRRLRAVGVNALVVMPAALGGARRQKTDRLDAQALCDALDRYVRGCRKALTVVTVPAEQAEQARAHSRVRNQLRDQRMRSAAQGRSLLLTQGFHVSGAWWQGALWERLQNELPPWLTDCLRELRVLALAADKREQVMRAQLETEAQPVPRPKAIGALTWVLLARELCDWRRFKNRRQVAGYTGLCPGVDQSGARCRDGSINRCGNPRVRALLIEAVWRLARWQPTYAPVQKLAAKVVRGAARRKLAVAAARRLAIDLWRLATAQTTMEKLNLTPA